MADAESITAPPALPHHVQAWVIDLHFDATEAEARELLAKLSMVCGSGSVAGLRRDDGRDATS